MTDPNVLPPNPPVPPPGGAPPAAPPSPAPVAQPPTPPAAAAPPAQPPQHKKKVPSTRDLAGIRKSSESKGFKRAQREYAKQAKDLGYASVTEMFTAIQEGRKGNPTPQDQPPPKSQPDARKTSRLEKKIVELTAANSRLRKRVAITEKKLRIQKQSIGRLSAEGSLREDSVRAGVTDVGYSLQLLRRDQLAKKARGEKLDANFDSLKWFQGLKKTHPILFTPQEEFANTGHGPPAGAPPAPPKNGGTPPPAPGVDDPKPTDARDMTKQQFDKKLADMGIRNPSGSRAI